MLKATHKHQNVPSTVELSSTARFLLNRKQVWTDTYIGDLPDIWIEHIAHQGHFLIHTTRYPHAVLNSNRILKPEIGQKYVSMTRSPAFAEYWADNNRPDDEGMAAHLILDKNKLQHSYKIETFCDPWNQPDGATGEHRYESEERIAQDVFPLMDVLHGVVFVKDK